MADIRKYQTDELLNKVLNSGEDALKVDIDNVTLTTEGGDVAIDVALDKANDSVTVYANTAADGSGTSTVPLVDAAGNLQIDIVSSALPSGGATAANQSTIIGHVDGIETLLTGIDADTDAIKTAVQILDDWDDSNYANVNINLAGSDAPTGGGAESGALRVTIANDSTGVVSVDDNGGTLSIDDGGGAITVDGTVTANLSATDNAVLDSIDSDTSAIKTAVEIIDNAVHVDDAGFTLGTHSGMMMMGFAGAQSVDANDAGAIAMDTDGAVHIADGGNVISVDDGGSTISIDDGGATISIDDGAGSITVDGAVTATLSAEGTDGSAGPAKTLSVGGTESGGNIQELRVDSDGHLQIDVLSGGGGTEYSEDVATPGTITGLATMMERDDALGGLTPAEGEWASLRCDANGALWTHDDALDAAIDGNYLNVNMNLAGSDAQAGEGTISATTQRVTIATDDDGVAHLATIAGAVSTQMQVDIVAALPAGDNNIGNVDIVTLPASTNTIEVVGDAAENANAAGNPVLVGGRYDSPGNDNSSLRTLGDTDVGALALDPTGAVYVREALGQAGSCFVSGTSAVTAAIGKFVAIQFLEDTVFNSTNGLVATDTGRWPDDSAAASDVSSLNTAAVGSQVFPQGMTIFGRWDSFILVSGAVIAYVGNV